MTGNTLEVIVNKQENPDFVLVDLIGDMDSYNIKEKRKGLEQLVNEQEKQYLVFNLMGLNYINSESIGLLFNFNEILKAKNKKLVLVAPKKNVADILNEIGLFEAVTHFDTMQEFLKSLENA